MFITVQADEYHRYAELLVEMFRLRKRVFLDELGWDVAAVNDEERDVYDNMGPVYLLWCSNDCRTLYASMRLMPTTGPTLLYDVFRNTFPRDIELSAPGTWEATRCCVDKETIARDFPHIDLVRAFCLLSLAGAECAQSHGISSVVANYEPHMARVYSRAGLQIEEIGRADGYGKLPVCCGHFPISREIVERCRSVLQLTRPLTQKPFWPRQQDLAGAA